MTLDADMHERAERHENISFLAALHARGIDTTDVRDGAHEAFHVLTSGYKGDPGDREAIHRALVRKFRGNRAGLWVNEIQARVVEQEICKRVGADPRGDLSKWLHISAWEATSFGLVYGEHETSLSLANGWAATKECAREVERVFRWVR
jgi:hypothetical protein